VTGPKEIGVWSDLHAPNIKYTYGSLRRGCKYRVIKTFTESGTIHPLGEQWTFLASAFLPHDNGLQWFVTFDGKQEWSINLWLDAPEEAEIERKLDEYIERIV